MNQTLPPANATPVSEYAAIADGMRAAKAAVELTVDNFVAWKQAGKTYRQIAGLVGCGVSTVHRFAKKHGIDTFQKQEAVADEQPTSWAANDIHFVVSWSNDVPGNNQVPGSFDDIAAFGGEFIEANFGDLGRAQNRGRLVGAGAGIGGSHRHDQDSVRAGDGGSP